MQAEAKNKYAIIMAGGIGSRFWPASRTHLPKQFIDILGIGESLITSTFKRLAKLINPENILVVTNSDYINLVKKHIPGIESANIIAEPLARNTAPCIALAAKVIEARNPNAVFVVAPSDHFINDEAEFLRIIDESFAFANQYNCLITLGIQPTRPDTGYGYIQYNPITSGGGFHEVKTFTEKPSLEIAQTFIESGEFLWNAGIFVWNLNTIQIALEKHVPEIYQLFSELNPLDKDFTAQLEIAYGQCPNESIDKGVMEKDQNVYVYPSNFGWNDLGTWKSLWDIKEKSNTQTAVVAENLMQYETSNSLIFSNTDRLIITKGIDNLVIVDDGDVLLIMNKDNEQELRNIVNDVKDKFKERYS